MLLPSGRALAYPFPHLINDERGNLVLVHKDNENGKWVDVNHFGRPGTWKRQLTENAVSAVARDIFAAAMPRLEAAGYPIVLHVHDEIVAEVPIGFGSVEEFKRIITAVPDWAAGLPIAAKGEERERFCKIKPPQPDGADRLHHEDDDVARDDDDGDGDRTADDARGANDDVRDGSAMRNRDGYPIGNSNGGDADLWPVIYLPRRARAELHADNPPG
jgi:hypothetical protein